MHMGRILQDVQAKSTCLSTEDSCYTTHIFVRLSVIHCYEYRCYDTSPALNAHWGKNGDGVNHYLEMQSTLYAPGATTPC